ncbi:MAG: hypothetical protein AAGC72_13555 [Planctomycetota bacterium]
MTDNPPDRVPHRDPKAEMCRTTLDSSTRVRAQRCGTHVLKTEPTDQLGGTATGLQSCMVR